MGLLSDLFNKVKKGIDEIENAIDGDKDQSDPAYTAPTVDEAPAAPSYDNGGDSYYDRIPDEECQYNYSGSYIQYFEMIFREDFPAYDFTSEQKWGEATVFTLTKDGKTALVVELLRETSGAKKIRSDCAAAGIPYLRFYYNHEGWWNARSYVVNRVKAALGE